MKIKIPSKYFNARKNTPDGIKTQSKLQILSVIEKRKYLCEKTYINGKKKKKKKKKYSW